MKSFFLILLLFCFFPRIIIDFSFGDENKTQKNTPEKIEVKSYWTCPMHPEVHSSHPGDCPICHMKLIKKEDKVILDSSKINQRKSIELDQKSFNLSGAQLYTVTKGDFSYVVRTFGKMNGGNSFSMYVSEKDQRFVKLGGLVKLKIPSQDLLEIEGVVTKIDTYIEPMGRTVKVDGIIKSNQNLRAETSILGSVVFKKKDIVKIPEEALLHAGEKDYVFLFDEKKSLLNPTIVKIGLIANGEIEILTGLNAGNVVTTHSNFLIDSESRMRFNYDQKNN